MNNQTTTNEIWKTIEEYPNYEVSNMGKIRNKKTGRIAFVSGAVNSHSSLEFTDRTQQTDHRCRRRNRRGW